MRKNRKYLLRLALAVLLLCGALSACTLPWSKAPKAKVPATYPYVFVHGLNGFGDDAGVPVSYWGGTDGALLPALQGEGFTCYAPTVSAVGSAWDRACELYAQLIGAQVDYGAAHSAAHGHDRLGKEYAAPLFPGWGIADENNNLRKVNLIAHSFGGATARVLCALLKKGSPADVDAAKAAGTTPSPLFVGGKDEWVFSLTCIAAPHNGVSLLTIADVNPLIAAGTGLLASFKLDEILSSAGISFGGMRLSDVLQATKTQDTAYYDLGIAGAKAVNEMTCLNEQTYYFSIPVDGTNKGVPTNDMSLPLRIVATLIGGFTSPENGVNDEWKPNDGLVNTISATRPFSEAGAPFAENQPVQPALWNILPTVRGDHGSVVGLGHTLAETLPLYQEQMRRIDALSRKCTGE
ncbi:MAG: hypothetical protein LBB50_00655 [Oscillospiraceae bacterium]|jgi:triacylglycerol lipase|nr:hypothetical protein [Oscillospiraceae bacterium]